MPEGHTIHRIARDHQKWFAGQKLIVTSPQGRFEDEAKRVSGKKLREVTAHGKHLFYHWNRNLIGHIHLHTAWGDNLGTTGRQLGDNHKVKLGKKRSKTNGVKPGNGGKHLGMHRQLWLPA